jgi:hypothetical protein
LTAAGPAKSTVALLDETGLTEGGLENAFWVYTSAALPIRKQKRR